MQVISGIKRAMKLKTIIIIVLLETFNFKSAEEVWNPVLITPNNLKEKDVVTWPSGIIENILDNCYGRSIINKKLPSMQAGHRTFLNCVDSHISICLPHANPATTKSFLNHEFSRFKFCGILYLTSQLKSFVSSKTTKSQVHRWTIDVDLGLRLNITFLEFNIPRTSPECMFLFLAVYQQKDDNMERLLKSCGHYPVWNVVTSSSYISQAVLELYNDLVLDFNIVEKVGLVISFQCFYLNEKPQTRERNITGFLTNKLPESLFTKHNSYDFVHCWTILTEVLQRIEFSFSRKAHQFCTFYDGPTLHMDQLIKCVPSTYNQSCTVQTSGFAGVILCQSYFQGNYSTDLKDTQQILFKVKNTPTSNSEKCSPKLPTLEIGSQPEKLLFSSGGNDIYGFHLCHWTVFSAFSNHISVHFKKVRFVGSDVNGCIHGGLIIKENNPESDESSSSSDQPSIQYHDCGRNFKLEKLTNLEITSAFNSVNIIVYVYAPVAKFDFKVKISGTDCIPQSDKYADMLLLQENPCVVKQYFPSVMHWNGNHTNTLSNTDTNIKMLSYQFSTFTVTHTCNKFKLKQYIDTHGLHDESSKVKSKDDQSGKLHQQSELIITKLFSADESMTEDIHVSGNITLKSVHLYISKKDIGWQSSLVVVKGKWISNKNVQHSSSTSNLLSLSSITLNNTFYVLLKDDSKLRKSISQKNILDTGDHFEVVVVQPDLYMIVDYYLFDFTIAYVGKCQHVCLETQLIFTTTDYEWEWPRINNGVSMPARLINFKEKITLKILQRRFKFTCSMQKQCNIDIVFHMDRDSYNNVQYVIAFGHLLQNPAGFCPSGYR